MSARPARLRIALLLVVAILVQTTLGSDLRVTGVAPDLMVLLDHLRRSDRRRRGRGLGGILGRPDRRPVPDLDAARACPR